MRFVKLLLTATVCAFAAYCVLPAVGIEPVEGKLLIISNINSAKPLTIESGSKNAGAKVIQDSSAKLHVAWKLEKVGDGYFRIVNTQSGLALTVPVNMKEPAIVVQAPADNGDNQAWKFVKVEKFPTHYWIINKNTGLVLDISQASKANGGVLIQYPQKDAGTKNQHWTLKATKK